MFRRLFQPLLHLAILLIRPLTIGTRGICYDPTTKTILLVKHTYSENWALPGGGVEVGESVLSALKREVSEESGIDCKSARVIGLYHNLAISKRDHVVIYIIDDWQKEITHERPKLEIAEVAWFRLSELPEYLTPCSEFGIRKYQMLEDFASNLHQTTYS